ncbi:hypothetical protein MLD38_038954 [Melastoma candidum]|uniref:Uncharacterized protein n=1 Tax=Melastoma candidum TaxID=119954 RepID=A0ACB9L1R6_9MYRT|nr:hypothetical protein MLD38_038954 [Melastoma candidum]
MEVHHFSHEHPLILDRVDDSGETCNACSRPIFDQGLACSSCGFLLHEKCAMLPRELSHHLHPQHPLTLVFDPSQDSESLKCSVCGRTHPGFLYRCNECKYNIDVNCFSKNQMLIPDVSAEKETRKLQHFSHNHPLRLSYLANQSARNCYFCRLPVSGPAYCCTECRDFTLHKSCSQLPQCFTEHPFHPSHTLRFLHQSPYPALCDACRKPIVGLEYHCNICKFDLDLTCLSISSSLRHKIHSHPLYYFEDTKLDISCASCKKKCRESVYRCVPCNYNVHSTCLQFPKTVKHKHHQHTLTLMDSVIKEDSVLCFCESCKKRISQKQRIYYCAECKYGVHLECVAAEDYPDPGRLLEEIINSQAEAEVLVNKLKQEVNSLLEQLQAVAGRQSSISDLQSKLQDTLKARA